MSIFAIKLRAAALALAIVFGAYAAVLYILSIRLFSVLNDCLLGVAMVMAGAWLARHALRRGGPNNPFRLSLTLCRELPLGLRMAGSVLLVAMAVAFDAYFDDEPGELRLSTFIVPVMISVIIFRLRPGLIALGASALAVDYFIIPPADSFLIETFPDSLVFVIYIIACGTIAALIELAMALRAQEDKIEELPAAREAKNQGGR